MAKKPPPKFGNTKAMPGKPMPKGKGGKGC